MREVSGSELAELTGRTWRTIKGLFEQAGLRPKRVDGRAHLYDSEAALRVIFLPDGSGDFDDQRQRLAAAQSEKIERDNAVRRGDLVGRKDADRFWSDCISNARARMLAVGAKLGPRLVNIGDANLIASAIRAEICAGLGELVEYDPEPRECADVDSGGVEAVGTAADPDGERVERPRAKAVNGKQRRARAVEN